MTDYLDKRQLQWKLVPFDGRSDYAGFIVPGIDIPAGIYIEILIYRLTKERENKDILYPHPLIFFFPLLPLLYISNIGGLFTGAEGIKGEAERIKFGGFANAAYDPCYHQVNKQPTNT